jgi:hypothetical protein
MKGFPPTQIKKRDTHIDSSILLRGGIRTKGGTYSYYEIFIKESISCILIWVATGKTLVQIFHVLKFLPSVEYKTSSSDSIELK